MKKLLYLALTVLIISCSSDDNSNVDDTQAEWLYVHTAIEANATNSRTLVIPVTNDIFAFTDRPDREHKYISAYEFVSYWSDNATNSFQFDPPNAVLTSVGDDGVAEVEVVIIDASTDGDNITYTIQNPKLTDNATFEDVSLFVDDNVGVGSDFYIYQSYQGGRIAYIDSTGQHGLIAATEDYNGYLSWDDAMSYCADYTVTVGGNTYNDWYLPGIYWSDEPPLPQIDELNQLYVQRSVIRGFNNQPPYWSSSFDIDTSEGSGDLFYFVQDFNDGSQESSIKSNAVNVRAVRAF